MQTAHYCVITRMPTLLCLRDLNTSKKYLGRDMLYHSQLKHFTHYKTDRTSTTSALHSIQ